MSQLTEVLKSRQARFFGSLCIALGLIAVGGGAYSGIMDPASALWIRIAQTAIPVLVGGLLITGGWMLAQRRGGLYASSDQYLLFGDSDSDVLRLPHGDTVGIYTWELHERFGEEVRPTWVVELQTNTGVRVLLGESDDERGLKHAAHDIASHGRSGMPADHRPEAPSGLVAPSRLPSAATLDGPGQLTTRVGVGGTLARTLLVGGPSMIAVGLILMSDVGNNNVFGFLFGPLFVALGLALGAVPVISWLAVARLTVTTESVAIVHEALGFKFGRREIPRHDDAYVRIRQRGLLGAGLEVVSDGHVLLACSGVHSNTALTPDGLKAIGAWLAASLSQTHA